MTLKLVAASLLLLIVLPAGIGGAQESASTAVTVAGGAFFRDRGEDSAPFIVVRGSRQLSRALVLELGVGTWSFDRLTGDGYDGGAELINPRNQRIPVAVVDLAVQRQWTVGPVRPYVGLGVGLIAILRSTISAPRSTRPSLSTALGLRASVTQRVVLQGDFRVRTQAMSVSPDVVCCTETTLGVAWQW